MPEPSSPRHASRVSRSGSEPAGAAGAAPAAPAGLDFDVLVIGGGINGAGVARDAALRGFRVLLVEKHDLGWGSSSRTSKLVHGGIRYLEQGHLRLVWEACHERQRLLQLAPHLVRPLPFVFPVYRGSRIGTLRLRLGMWLYDLLAAFRNVKRHRMLGLRDAGSWREGLQARDLRGAALYYDATMDDARLVLANAVAAREAGSSIRTGVTASALRLRDGRITGAEIVEARSGARLQVSARCTVACTGPWTNAFLDPLPGARAPLAPTRGTHLVVRRLVERAFTLAAERDGRVFFVLPWLGLTLVGTTDVEDAAEPERVQPSQEEVDYLLAETNRYFPDAHLGRADVLAAFAGSRPLLRSAAAASQRSREHAVLEPAPGLLAVAGGKYTTYRAVAEEVVNRLEADLGRRGPCRTAHAPLPGGDLVLRLPESTPLAWSAEEHWKEEDRFVVAAAALAAHCGLGETTARHLLRTHGSRAAEVAALVRADPALASLLCAHHPHIRAEVVQAVRHELALHLEDWYLRRSHQAYSACQALEALEDVTSLFASELHWSAVQCEIEMQECRAVLAALALNRSPTSSPAA